METNRAIVRVQGQEVKVGNTHNWRGLVATFTAEQDVRESSRALYVRTLSQFMKWAEDTGRQLSSMDKTDILSFKDELTAKGLSPLTIGSYLVTVRKFYEWAESYKLYPNIAKGVKTPKRTQDFEKQHLSEEKSGELLSYFAGKSLRDYAIVNLALRCGLRTVEIARADVGDITFKGERRVLRIWGKGRDGKDDFVVLSEKAYRPIAEYLNTRKGAKAGEPLFVSQSKQNRGERLTTRAISGICKEGLRAVGLDGREYSAHSLRHTTAVSILKHTDMNIYQAQLVLRHSSPVTTEVYVRSLKREDSRIKNAPELVLDSAF